MPRIYFNCQSNEYSEFQNWALASQGKTVNCTPYLPIPTCFYEITGTSKTNVTTRGGSDGEITAGATGSTGQTYTWYINGVVSSETGYTVTFTGLTAGFYQVTVEDPSDTDCFNSVEDIQIVDGEFRTGDMDIKPPANLTASENPINYEIRTAINGNGLASEMELLIYSGVSDGDYFKFELTSPFEYTQTFYSKGFPNKSNFFLASELTDQEGVAAGTNTTAEIAQSLADALQQDAVIPKVYYINYDGGTTINLKAKELGEKYTLSNNNVTKSGQYLGINTLNVGVNKYDGQQVDNYSIYAEVFLNDTRLQYPDTGSTANYQRIAELELPFNQTNIHTFNLAPILKNFVYSNRPEYDFTGYTILPDMMKPYFVRYGEKYPLVQNTNTKKKRYKDKDTTKWVINSALDHFDSNNMSGYTTANEYKFLSNSPNPKLIQRQSQEFLYFIVEKDLGATLDVRGDLYFYDGTSVTGQTFITISTGSTNAGGVLMLNLSYDKLGLENYEVSGSTNRKIKRAEFAVYSGGTQYTEERAYRFEIEDKPRKFGCVFQNKLGGYDSFDFIGVVERTVSRTTGTYTVPIAFNQDGSAGQGFKSTATYNTKVVNKLIMNSGWIDVDHFEWLKELLESNDVYSYTTDNQNYLNLSGFKYKRSSLDDLYEVEVTFDQTIYENSIEV